MPESFLGGGLIFEENLPLAWTPGPLAEGLSLARFNSDNQQLLGAEASLDDVRIGEALKDESAALLHELQRLEYKMNILLRLVAELRSGAMPPLQRVKIAARALEWFSAQAPAVGETGLLALYINPALPQPLKIPCCVVGQRREDDLQIAQMQFAGLSDAVVELLEKLIFRHHRRLIAGSRLAAH
jgi:Atypical PilZ domain, cyclic di-GMP receptor